MTGLASAATGVFAIPELIEDRISGWLLPCDVNDDGNWRFLGKPEAALEWPDFQRNLEERIFSIGVEVSEDPSLPDRFGQAAFKKLYPLYNPYDASRRLAQIYGEALTA